VIRAFGDLGGDLEHAYLVSWPHGWDYRALGIELGDPDWRNVLEGNGADMTDAVEAARGHASDPARKLYIVGGPGDTPTRNLETLQGIYPDAVVTRHEGHYADKGFFSVYVPGDQPGAATGALDD
jgi:hypothetical protein